MRHLTGCWLFDVYPARGGGVTVWLIDSQGVAHQLHDELTPFFFIEAPAGELRKVCQWLRRARLPVALARTERHDLMRHRDVIVLQVRILVAEQYERIVRRVIRTFPRLGYHHADLTVAQFYFFERSLFPVARCDAVADDNGKIVEITTADSLEAIDYTLPPLRIMRIHMEGDAANPKDPSHGYRAPLIVAYEGHEYTLTAESPKLMLETLRSHLHRYDPDVLLSDFGDAFILGHLLELAREYGVMLPFNRDAGMQPRERGARSRLSYGRILYQPASHTLYGRWHLDHQSGLMSGAWGLHGVVELARLSQRAVQHCVHSTIGGAVSALENAIAFKSNCLIPLVKEQTEEAQNLEEFLRSDRGGLVYQPLGGVHYDVIELDFVAAFLAIMAKFNISGETVNCDCCDNFVPELNMRICQKRLGLIPVAARILLTKRFAYKRLKRETLDPILREIYRLRDEILKMAAVTIFGYTGHDHAKFGLIAAHAAVCAYARESILCAKDVVERSGFRILHIIVDSVWIQKAGATDKEIEALIHEIERATGLPLAFEARYKWVAFLNSRMDPRRTVATRYFAATREGETKIRGIESRRHDTPAWIDAVQCEMIEKLAEAKNRRDLAARVSELTQIVTRELDRLRSGQVPLHELTIRSSISKLPNEYKMKTLNAIVAQQLDEWGVTLHLGEQIRYLVLDHDAAAVSDRAVPWDLANAPVEYDVEFYEKLLLRAADSVFSPFGVNETMLRDSLTKRLPLPAIQKRVAAKQAPYWGPLFAGLS